MDNLLLYGEALVKEYGAMVKTRALDGVDFQIQKGEFMSIIGASGCGKTTLLNLVGALDFPTSGSMLFEGENMASWDEEKLAKYRNHSIGFVFQFHHLLPEFTALENVLMPAWINRGFATKEKEKRGIELLELVGLGNRMNNMSANLSGGQQQRVSIARALINDPQLVLADEPTGNLDSDATAQVFELLRSINHQMGIAFCIVTHDIGIANLSDHMIEMKDGKIINDQWNNVR